MGLWTRREWMQGCAGAGLLAAAGRMRGLAQAAETGMRATAGPDRPFTGAVSLRSRGAQRGVLMGCAVNTGLLAREESYRQTLAEQFDLVVGENCMKWGALRPTPTTYDFKDADALVAFAEGHSMKVRGHNLCWHESLPGWFAGTVTKENARAVLTEHIATVVGRYKGRIQSWDVVNEAIWIKDGQGDGMRSSSPWFQMLGPEYVEIAFRAARAADPKVKLTYNDFGIESDVEEQQQKRAAVLALVRRLKGAGVPLDAVGIQSHLKATNAAKLGEGISEFSGKIRKMGLEVYVTELDVDDDGLPDESLRDLDLDVADVYKRYLNAMLKGPEVKAVLCWGLADGQSWLQGERWRVKHPIRKQRPLLFEVDDSGTYRPTEAYYAVQGAVDGAKRR